MRLSRLVNNVDVVFIRVVFVVIIAGIFLCLRRKLRYTTIS